MKHFATYVRVSTLDQSFDRQISDISRFIEYTYRGEEFSIEVYNEKISGYKNSKKRPELDKLVTKFRSDLNYYDCIFVTELSRLGRNPTETRILVNELLENKIDICVTGSNGGTFFLNSDKTINKTQLAVFQLLMEFSDIEIETFKNRSASGRREKILQGGSAGGTYKQYGYTGVDKKMVIDENEAVIVRQVFQDYKNGLGMQAIANKLNNDNVPTKAVNQDLKGDIKWDATQIMRLLKNDLYIGIRTFNKHVKKEDSHKTEKFDSPHLAIIDKELFDECTAIRLNKAGNGRNIHTKNVILLQYLMKCGKCGRNFSHRAVPNIQLYCCASKITKPFKSCGNTGINIDMLDSSIYDVLCKTPRILQYLSDTEKIKGDVARKIELIELNLPVLEKELTKYEKRIDKIMNDYYDDKVPPALYHKKLEEFNNDKANIEIQISTQRQQLISNKKTLADLDKPATNTQILIDAKTDRNKLQSIFRQIIKSIEVHQLTANLVKCDIKFNIAGKDVPYKLIMILKKRNYNKKDGKVPNYKTFLVKDFESFDHSEQMPEDYFDADFYDDSKFLGIKDWDSVTDNQLFLF